jgi:hypothetical protein
MMYIKITKMDQYARRKWEKKFIILMNTTSLGCDAIFDMVRDAIYRTFVGPTYFVSINLFISTS